MREVDLYILTLVNSFAGRSLLFDNALYSLTLSNLYLFISAPLVAILSGFWFSKTGEPASSQRCVIAAMAGTLFALTCSRIVQDLGPERPRPLHASDLVLQTPHGVPLDALAGWSSFPSDTTALLAALATGIWLVSRPLGVVAGAWVLLVAAFPRVFAGYHYPSDVLAGAVLGVFSVLLVYRSSISDLLTRAASHLSQSHPVLFYSSAFLFFYQVTVMFSDLRAIGRNLSKALAG
jgi:membrane-associated phospholipid phosphatase